MRVLIRCDIGGDAGMGHAVRCLALAQALTARGVDVRFFTKTPALAVFVDPYACDLREEHVLLTPGDVLVFDHKTDIPSWAWLCQLRHDGYRTVCIDHPHAEHAWDLVIAPCAHWDADVVARFSRDFGDCFFYGWDYVMLNDDVTAQVALPYDVRADGPIVFCAGGSDPTGALETMLAWSADLLPDVHKLFLFGAQSISPYRQRYEARLAQRGQDAPRLGGFLDSNLRFIEPFRPAALRSAALVVTLFGVTVYECLYYATPTLMLAQTAENMLGAEWCEQNTQGAAHFIGSMHGLTPQIFCDVVTLFWAQRERQRMHAASVGLCDGHGVARVADVILALG